MFSVFLLAVVLGLVPRQEPQSGWALVRLPRRGATFRFPGQR
jgi:hypothetical protein